MWIGVILLDHLDAGAAVLGDLVDVGAFHEPHTDIGMPQAVSSARIAIAVRLELRPFEHTVESLT